MILNKIEMSKCIGGDNRLVVDNHTETIATMFFTAPEIKNVNKYENLRTQIYRLTYEYEYQQYTISVKSKSIENTENNYVKEILDRVEVSLFRPENQNFADGTGTI